MEELIAKKYVKALKDGSDFTFIQEVQPVFDGLAKAFQSEKFLSIVSNPSVSTEDKSSLLLDVVKPAKSEKLDNFLKLLVEHKRINIIPAIAQEIAKDIANTTKTYTGEIFSDSEINQKVIDDLASGLSKKFDATISLEFVKNDFNGIKVAVEGLGIEINFSKDRIDSQIIEHIIKAI